MDIEVRHLRHAKALAEHRSFARAAEALGLTQPTLSRSIQELERRVGMALFNRAREGIDPTEMGRVLLARATVVLSEAAELGREMNLIRGMDVGELKVGAGAYPSEMFVAHAVAALVRQYPGLKIRLLTNVADTLINMLRRKELDLVIADPKTTEGSDDLHAAPLSWHRGYAVVRAGHPLLDKKYVTISDLLRFPLVLTSNLPPDMLSMLSAAMGKGPRREGSPGTVPAIGCDTPSMMRIIASGSDAVALLPLNVIEEDLARGRLVILPYSESWLGRKFAIIRLARRIPSPAAEAFAAKVTKADLDLQSREQNAAIALGMATPRKRRRAR